LPLVTTALQVEQGALLTLTLTPLADVAPLVLLLGLLAKKLMLHDFAPMYTTLIDPP
jgi:hypothetical protein